MSFEELLGRTISLRIKRLAGPGAFLDAGPDCELLLPGAQLPANANVGDLIEAFVYLDSEDRPIATTARPALELDEVTFLTVSDLSRFGAFFDWGLPKELLVPFAEQTCELARGDLHPIGLVLDDTGRLMGTMRIRELLEPAHNFKVGDWLQGEAWREEPGIGVFIILERKHLGLVPAHEAHGLWRGQAAQFRVTHVWPDGKVELSPRGLGYEEIEKDARRILKALALPNPPRVSDKSSPEELRDLFGLSKKAFKRALGKLLKEGAVELDKHGEVQLAREQ